MMYRKKPVEVEAMMYEGLNMLALQSWGAPLEPRQVDTSVSLWIAKSAAYGLVRIGDWVIKERDGDGFYPCVASEFQATYEPARPAPEGVERDGETDASRLAREPVGGLFDQLEASGRYHGLVEEEACIEAFLAGVRWLDYRRQIPQPATEATYAENAQGGVEEAAAVPEGQTEE